MDFQKIILESFLNQSKGKKLHKRFIRTYEDAEKYHYDAEEFFEGLIGVIEIWEGHLEDKVNEQKTKLYGYRNKVINGTAKITSIEGKTKEETKNEILNHWKSDLEKISKNDFKLHIQFDGSYFEISYNEILYIKESIEKAFSLTVNQKDDLQQIDKNKPVQSEKLSDLITHKKSSEIVEKIKIQYRNIKGKRLKLLLRAFQYLELLPKERIAKRFHDCCKNEFDWKIASYNAMNGYNYNDITDKAEFDSMKVYLETLVKN
ncbi:hypothetical protein LZ575_03125 [Antarcticibacterium sp. 1MA-6-2]|uniref:hypothetical protein n=1 Tax=Antarcticibacterium sp. 1MA-6-2 TaxID=2908210 RepID=UPI001F341336|nr:hypothetical protein [Antarcticibacterium sp. 1MA-6-2]UJH91694.1 hypothetical protein LZ575_03125 [Antarcticibacterium sp. 1MA-6-2]